MPISRVLFGRYADVGYIAASALGPRGKKASAGQKKAFADGLYKHVTFPSSMASAFAK